MVVVESAEDHSTTKQESLDSLAGNREGIEEVSCRSHEKVASRSCSQEGTNASGVYKRDLAHWR